MLLGIIVRIYSDSLNPQPPPQKSIGSEIWLKNKKSHVALTTTFNLVFFSIYFLGVDVGMGGAFGLTNAKSISFPIMCAVFFS